MELSTLDPSPPVATSVLDSTPPLEWIFHPARQSPFRLILLGIVLAAVAWTLLLVEQNVVLPLTSVALLVFALSPFLFPTRYRLTRAGIECHSPFRKQQRTFADLRRWQEDVHGILVSPYRQPSFLDDLRGLYLQGGNRLELRARLESILGPATPLPQPRRLLRRSARRA